LSADLHEFEITPQGTALITAEYPVHWNLSGVHGLKNGSVFDSVVQEIDIPTGLVLFQWDSLDHVPVTDTYEKLPKNPRFPFDYFHVNSVEPDNDGTIVISGRNTWAAYKVDHRSGATIWILGGKRSMFRMGPGASFAFQHDVRVRAGHDLFVTLFDDGGGPPNVHRQSRGLKLFLDLRHHFAKAVGQDKHSPPLLAGFEGNYQQLAPGEDFLGWGQQPYFTEYNSHDQEVFDGHFIGGNASYRAYRFRWTGTPQTPPAVATSHRGAKTTVYVSWNGATNVAKWRVLGGRTPTVLRDVATAPKRGFETSIATGAQQYVAVQALDTGGHTLATSATVRAR
jgi:Arylsulfotransferase (ASST)